MQNHNLENIVLTQDQEELIFNLEEFLTDNRCYFGVYGPAGSGKSFTITYFIEKYNLYEKVLLSGTTNNACRVLEQTLEKNSKVNINSFNENLNMFISEIKMNIQLLNENSYKIDNKDTICSYFEILIKFTDFLNKKALDLSNNNSLNSDKRDNTLKYLNNENIIEIKNEISNFINQNCSENLLDKLYIKYINNILENIFHKNKYIKTIHSLLNFEQCRDENHNIVFLPSKSNIKESKGKNGVIKYEFTPKLTGKRKIMYDNMDNNEKKDFEEEYYKKCFSKLTEIKLLIIDESSMMKEIEFRYIIYICKILKLKVIFLGDKYQLPPVNDDDPKNTSIDNDISSIIDYSPAVKLKSSFTLSTIKRTSNPVLQEIYKTFRDLVEKTSQGKIKLHNIQFTKNIQTTDKYIIQTKNEVQKVIEYIQLSDNKLENTRILCFSNKEVNKMNHLMRINLYGIDSNKYVNNETLLVSNYMLLPKLNMNQLILIESCLKNNNKQHFNYIFNKLTEDNIKTTVTNNKLEYSYLVNAFKDINNKENKIKLYTSCCIKIIKIVETQVYVKEKILNVSVVFFEYDGLISLFFNFNNMKENEYVKNMLKSDKQLIKLKTDLYRLHNCNDNCDSSNSGDIKIKKHTCLECVNPDMCIHYLQICDKETCSLVCNKCYECNPECLFCIKQHRNNYSTLLWNKFISKEYILDPNVNYSYATTVHKAQGQSIDNIVVSEYNIANCILHNNEIQEYQKLLIYPTCMYTAVTRAKNILVRLK